MPKGAACTFCNLPDEPRSVMLAAWRDGASYTRLTSLAGELGVRISQSSLQFCPVRSGHHGRRVDGDVQATTDRLGRIADLLERSGIRAEDVGQVKSVRLSEWEGLSKNEDGDAVVTPLSGASIVLTPAWADGPQWQPVDRAAQAPVKVPPAPPVRSRRKTKTAVVLPDVQIGYRRDLDTAALDPFHDEAAMAAALKVVQAADPDVVIHLGDFLDFASFGTYEIEAGFALTVQPAIDRAHRFLVEVQAAAPRARQVLLEGNHDRRLQKAIVKNALAAFGIRRAEAPDEWPVLSLPYLLRLSEIGGGDGVEYVGGYPAGIYWINDRLCCIHGHKVRSSGSTAAAVVQDDSARISTLFGHVHRVELMHRTQRVRAGARTSFAASPGCLCRIDGAVPSMKGSTDPMGRPVPTVENWQHGCAVITYEPGDGPFALELVPIHDGQVWFRGSRL